MAYLRDRRAFGNIGTRKFRGARFGDALSPRFSGLLDQYGGAAAAYSLRALSSGWVAGDVVEVRPSSGWTPASFTAGQVANGELVDYVKRPGDFTNTGFETFANNGTGDGFSVTNTAAIGLSQSSTVSGGSGSSVFITFDLSIVFGSPSLNLRPGINAPVSNSEVFTTSGSKSATLTATGNFDNFTFGDGDIPSEFTISNIRVSTYDGFVSTWYDQSGNANDATQGTTTAQPKIVSAGALVVGGLDFDGTDDRFFTTSVINSTNIAIAAVCKADADATQGIFSMLNDFDSGSELLMTSGKIRFHINESDLLVTENITEKNLYFANYDGSVQSLSANGVVNQQSASETVNVTSVAQVGARLDTGFFNGKITEIIIYNSDQSANRVGIETNINAAYTIY